ncbi:MULTISPECIES: bleomycin resistance protein [unclassified Rhodococcus (in: high G+C Gram-positive bacteria)]|uniref:bleomycin resistance protein n=1 Tax=unclassified Rhodococcus (in: high G+C Gram-positive bacteria) TaxID=192944 RepID=UPI001C9ACE11|nr:MULTISPECIES: VOC family protein [unclassified Rhodococcus (in: high G+C Gram-positive bacteria)]MBY6709169.1 VOC family protein [Rhodococcus sp. BP-241]
MGMSRVVPALPVRHIESAVAFYARSFGFTTRYSDPSFAKLTRDDVEIHLWAADDDSWTTRTDPAPWPVCSGAETFLAGTASCRIAVDEIDDLYTELSGAGVLHRADVGRPVTTDWGSMEFATVDTDGNLITFHTETDARHEPGATGDNAS